MLSTREYVHAKPGGNNLREHPFADTPQYQQQYGSRGGGNGLGLVPSALPEWSEDDRGFRPSLRPNSHGSFEERRRAFEDGEATDPAWDDYFAGSDDEHDALGNEQHAYEGPDTDAIADAWDKLTEKQRFVLGRRRGLNGDGHQYTAEQVAAALGVTHQAVTLIEQRADRRLRHLLNLTDAEPLPKAA